MPRFSRKLSEESKKKVAEAAKHYAEEFQKAGLVKKKTVFLV